MGSSRLRRLLWFHLQATTIVIVVFVLGVTVYVASDAPPNPTRALHEAARSYYLAAEASENDLDRALTLLHDASERLEHVTGDSDMEAIAGELSAHVRGASLVLETRHRRLAALSHDVARSLDRHDPQAALDQLSTVPSCPLGGPNASQMTHVTAKDCKPTSDTHFNLGGQHDRAQQDVTAAYAFVRQGDAATRQCADPRGALTAYRQAHDRNAMLALDGRIAVAKSCLPGHAWDVTRPR